MNVSTRRSLAAQAPQPSLTGEQAGFRAAQRLAYRCAVEVEGMLSEGDTEIAAAALLTARLAAAGVHHYFHCPLVWFGDRTVLADDWPDTMFQPSGRALRRGTPVILDVAPIIDGYVADIAYTFAFGTSPLMDRMRDDLARIRSAIPELLRRGVTLADAYGKIDRMIESRGYVNRHRAYPFDVIGHRVMRVQPREADREIVGVFGRSAVEQLRADMARATSDPASWPFWNNGFECAHPIGRGVWAIEPHIAVGDVGAKFEEILVVTDEDVFWLDDDLPHVRPSR